MFLHVSVILYTRGGLQRTPQDQADTPGPGRNHPPGPRRTPRTREKPPRTKVNPQTKENPPLPPDQADPPGPGRTPLDQGDPPPDPRRTHPPRTRQNPPLGRRLQHTVNERPVRILLECILVISNEFTKILVVTALFDIWLASKIERPYSLLGVKVVKLLF